MFHRRLFLLLAFCLFFLSLSQIAAQDETPTLTPFSTETPIPTLVPTETATELPSATPRPSETPTDLPSATPLPSETPTALPSETPTLLPTPTASETAAEAPTATVTVETSESPAPTLTLDASLSPSPSSTMTLTPTAETTVSSTATLLATASSTLVPTLTPIPKHPFLVQSALASQNLSGDLIEIRNIDDVSDFSMAIDTANANCNNTYVLYLTPNLYPVIPEAGENRGLTITGQVIIVGNAFNSPATSSTVPDTDKVIFEPDGDTGIFYVTSNNCGTEGSLSLYNVVLSSGRNTVNGGGGAITNESVLNIYNSYLVDNQASYWGGAILSTGTTTIINSVFENNQATSGAPTTGGGAISEIYSASLWLECTSFINNRSLNVGGALHFAQSVTGPTTLMHNADVQRSNNFINNTALIGYANIYNASPTIDAAYQHWDPTPSSGSVFGADYSAPLTLPVQLNCAIPPIPSLPTPTPTPTPTATPIPTCTELETIYTSLQNRAIDPSVYRQWLIDKPDSNIREVCLKLYTGLIYLAMSHELAGVQITQQGGFLAQAYYYIANTGQVGNNAEIANLSGQFAGRQISASDALPFSAAPQTEDVYYLFARTILNGIMEKAQRGYDPLVHFDTNFNSTVSSDFGVTPFCDEGDGNTSGIYTPKASGDRTFAPVCTNLEYWNKVVNHLTTNSPPYTAYFQEEYNRYLPAIYRAIHDIAFDQPDPTHGATAVRPVNRNWKDYHPKDGEQTFVFRSYLDKIVVYKWETQTNGEYYITSPIIYENGVTKKPIELNSCPLTETVGQGFMRNLQTIYGSTTFANLPAFPEDRGYFKASEVLFGTSQKPQNYVIIFHALVAERDDLDSRIEALSWQTFQVATENRPNEPQNRTIRPITGAEYVATEVITAEDGTSSPERIKPLICPHP